MNELAKRRLSLLAMFACALIVVMALVYVFSDSQKVNTAVYAGAMLLPFLVVAYFFSSWSWAYDQAQLGWEKRKRAVLTENARTLVHAFRAFADGRANVFSFLENTFTIIGVSPEYNFPYTAYLVNGKARFTFGLEKAREFEVEHGEMYIVLSKKDLVGWFGGSKTSSLWGIVHCWTELEGNGYVVARIMS
ncbi:hypothetical protein C4564_05235 [Candidatus Microgenomates bacterium]|nr:MAG: hypothetical protein C4564_05235 [Candidatus Microgenomates bacterium]